MRCRLLLFFVGMLVLSGFFVNGCSDDPTVLAPEDLNPPLGLYTIGGNGQVHLTWYTSNFEDGLRGYCVYMYDGEYTGASADTIIPAGFSQVLCVEHPAPSREVVGTTVGHLTNGRTYSFFVVAAKGNWRTISPRSNIVIDTPRPHITNLQLKNYLKGDGACALKFTGAAPWVTVVDEEGVDAAVLFRSFAAGEQVLSSFVGIQGRAQIQDLGYMENWNHADVVPEEGYPSSGTPVFVRAGHVYAVKTSSFNYGKIWIQDVAGTPADSTDTVNVWVAYQTQEGNPDLAPPGE